MDWNETHQSASFRVNCIPGLDEAAPKVQRVLRNEVFPFIMGRLSCEGCGLCGLFFGAGLARRLGRSLPVCRRRVLLGLGLSGGFLGFVWRVCCPLTLHLPSDFSLWTKPLA